jgi:hypothetical protein
MSDEPRKKTTKELDEQTERLLKEAKEEQQQHEKEMAEHKKEMDKNMAELKLRSESERIWFRRVKNGGDNLWYLTIYYDALTDAQKEELERVSQVLTDMAHEIKEEETRTIRKRQLTSGSEKEDK